MRTMTQPFTAVQLARRAGLKAPTCMGALRELETRGLVKCLNPVARQNRLYWLAKRGQQIRRIMFGDDHRCTHAETNQEVDWNLYGWVCFRHRAAIVRNMGEPMQPALIRRRARSREPGLRMSSNNTRDAMRLLLKEGVVRPVLIRKKAHARYALTECGRRFQTLLQLAEVPL